MCCVWEKKEKKTTRMFLQRRFFEGLLDSSYQMIFNDAGKLWFY